MSWVDWPARVVPNAVKNDVGISFCRLGALVNGVPVNCAHGYQANAEWVCPGPDAVVFCVDQSKVTTTVAWIVIWLLILAALGVGLAGRRQSSSTVKWSVTWPDFTFRAFMCLVLFSLAYTDLTNDTYATTLSGDLCSKSSEPCLHTVDVYSALWSTGLGLIFLAQALAAYLKLRSRNGSQETQPVVGVTRR
jgi:hypothetical protein